MLLNETAARQLFPGADPVGHRVHALYGAEAPATIVGVVGDVRADGPTEPAGAAILVPALQRGSTRGYFFVRGAVADPTSLVGPAREAVSRAAATVRNQRSRRCRSSCSARGTVMLSGVVLAEETNHV